ncbi:Lipoprotein signal peptidase [Frankliniella fusca]|uniref:Lipoprotein signal peptidase n=1 Tax=Frankliniella fusca TaxID=407009 RepID=A0AAE1HRD4_9NEOP|nr:Lipoprotein signal peptidase [Frankliniella fusca]
MRRTLPDRNIDVVGTARRLIDVRVKPRETNFALQLKGWRENMENFCGSKPPEGGCGSRQAQGFYPLWQPTASVFHGNRRFADCDPIAQFDRFDPRTTIGLPLEVRAVSRALDFLIPVSEALPQRGTRDSNPQPRVPTRSQNRKRPNAQSHRANGVRHFTCSGLKLVLLLTERHHLTTLSTTCYGLQVAAVDAMIR